MPGPVTSPTFTSTTSTGLGKLDSAVPARSAVFQHIDLPSDLSLGDMMSWLSKRMNDSDATIRGKMSDMNARKVQTGALNELIDALRASRMKNADAGGGNLQLSYPLDDPDALRASDFYKSLDPSVRGPLDSLLDSINPASWNVTTTNPETGAKVTINFKLNEGKIQGWEDGKGGVSKAPASLNKEKFEDAIQNLGNMAKDLGSRDEMQMIELQSAISARGQLLQMVSNMIASFNSTADKIVGNVR